jgi:hypothetical protein
MPYTLQIHYNSIVWELDKSTGRSLVLVWTIMAGKVHLCGLIYNDAHGLPNCLDIPAALLPKLEARAPIATALMKATTPGVRP